MAEGGGVDSPSDGDLRDSIATGVVSKNLSLFAAAGVQCL
jgi:hypothetical protein